VIEGFNEALKGMMAGEEKTIEVSPEKGYGIYDENLVEELDLLVGVYDIMEVVPKVTTLSLEGYMEKYGKDPLLGGNVTFPYGNGMITDIEGGVTIELQTVNEDEFYHNNVTSAVIDENDVSITIEHYPTDGGTAYTSDGGIAYVSVQEGSYIVEYDPDELEVGGTFANGKITEIGEDSFKVDRNHPMAGKTLYFRIKVMDFRKVR
jgi:hypothetical protein